MYIYIYIGTYMHAFIYTNIMWRVIFMGLNFRFCHKFQILWSFNSCSFGPLLILWACSHHKPHIWKRRNTFFKPVSKCFSLLVNSLVPQTNKSICEPKAQVGAVIKGITNKAFGQGAACMQKKWKLNSQKLWFYWIKKFSLTKITCPTVYKHLHAFIYTSIIIICKHLHAFIYTNIIFINTYMHLYTPTSYL